MTLDNFCKSCINPFYTILVFDEDESTLYDLHDFIHTRLNQGFSSRQIRNGQVTNICVNGDAIQCEVMINE